MILGISAGFHDAAAASVVNGRILYAGHAERYSKQKHDPDVNRALLLDALTRNGGLVVPKTVAYYEQPITKKFRQLYSGQYSDVFNLKTLSAERYLRSMPDVSALINCCEWKKREVSFKHYSHHLSHAAAGFQTSPYHSATVVVIDAIGEWDTISIYGARYGIDGEAKYVQLWSKQYPNSIGMFYSAMTKRVGLKPMDEEYILMGMAGYGKDQYLSALKEHVVAHMGTLEFSRNLHLGMDDFVPNANEYDLAASTQSLSEEMINQVMRIARNLDWSDNLVYTGGVALNCLANRNLGKFFRNIWIMPNPGDAGSSLGAAALSYGKKLDWKTPYLGTDIPGQYPVIQLLAELAQKKIVGVASGRAEFGPRALGNRSLLADPRGPDIKDRVNEIKRRQKFRPFAPVILEEFARDYFVMPAGWSRSPYMQVTAKCRDPINLPAIVHVDGTSRVQTVAKDCGSGIRELLEEWYKNTGCPMLLNTSLNIRGEPMVNDRQDADRFETAYGIKVFS